MFNNSISLAGFLLTALIIQSCSFIKKPDHLNKENLCDAEQSTKLTDKETSLLTAKRLDFQGDRQFLNHKYKNALACYKQALEIRVNLFGTSHLSLPKSLYNIATIHEVREKYDKAEYSYRRALNILKKPNQTKQPKVNEYLGYLAAIRYQKSSESTEKNLKDIVIAFKQLQDPLNIRVGVAEHRLAQIYLKSRNYSKSEKAYKNALLITQQNLGIQHPYYAKTLQDFSKLLLITKNKKHADKVLDRANLILKNYPKKLHTKLYLNYTTINHNHIKKSHSF